MPRFSVVVPAYNAVKTVEATIGSVLAQTVGDLELIVVDDGSADETPRLVAAIAADDARVELLEQPNQGTAGARNTGIARAAAPYVSFLDNDDLWLPDYLATMGEALDAEPDAAFAYCDAWSLVDATSRIRRRTELESRPGPAPDAPREQVFVTLATRNFVMSSVTARVDALGRSGGFDPAIAGTDDYDLWFRLLLDGGTAVRAGEAPLLLQRDRDDSQSKDDLVMLEGLALVLERVLADERTPAAARSILAERIDLARRRIAQGSEPSRATRLAGELRSRGVRLRERLFPGQSFYDEPPAAVTAAFPELARRRA